MNYLKNKSNATIYDIASYLNISASTVSRALNNKNSVTAKTRKKVIEAAKLLNYTPNIAARYLKTQKANQIMLSMPYMADEFFVDMISAVQAVAKSNGYSLILEYTENDIEEEIKIIRNVKKNFIDGLIMISLNFTQEHIREIEKLNLPVVLSSICKNRIIGGKGSFDYVGVDTKQGIYLATKHLIEQGHTKIGFIGHDISTQTGEERYKGFCLAMNDSGLFVNKEYIITTGKFSITFGYETGLVFAKMKDFPTAICVSADLIVLGLYRAFEQENIGIPDDISIIGMDNISTTTLLKPKVSTVALSQGEIGRYAANLIFKRLEGSKEPSQNIIFKPRLIIRESSINILRDRAEQKV